MEESSERAFRLALAKTRLCYRLKWRPFITHRGRIAD